MFAIRITIAVAALALVAALSALPASAKDGRDVRVQGVCALSSTAKMKLSPEDGGIEVEFEVDQNRNGVPWRVTIRRNGTVVTSTVARTRGPSGSFSVRRVVADSSGTDRIAALAVRSGERCTAQAAI
jgi:hypothetical protein